MRPGYADEEHVVYRLFDKDGGLLYIGMTGNFRARLREHRHGAAGATHPQIVAIKRRLATWTTTPYPNRFDALSAERAAIRAEGPELNTLRPKERPSMTLPTDYTLEQVADSLQMSPRWVRDRVREGAEHIRYGRKIRFTAEQVDKLRAGRVQNAIPQSVTTGRKRSR